MTLTVGSLFSGIGGLDLGLERAGFKVIWQSEIDEYASKVLKKHWPEVPNYGDIKQIKWADVERPNVICGGYPCQPFSLAGRRQGTDDPRHLWPWVRECISALRPDYAILENVRGHLSIGGLQVVGELAEIGYNAEWRIVSAAGLGAPHRRDRLIIVAYPNDARGGTLRHGTNAVGPKEIKERENVAQFGISRRGEVMANTTGERLGRAVGPVFKGNGTGFTNGGWWEIEPDVGRVANGVSNRVDRLKGLGNAVVPQVAEYIGRLVMAAHNNA